MRARPTMMNTKEKEGSFFISSHLDKEVEGFTQNIFRPGVLLVDFIDNDDNFEAKLEGFF